MQFTKEIMQDLKTLVDYESLLDGKKLNATDKFEYALFANILIFLKSGGSIEDCQKHMTAILERDKNEIQS
jgi:hypothetical protein